MLPRVNPIMLLGLIVALVLSVAILASARAGGGGGGGGGSADAALGAAMGQIGTPYGFGTDGGGSFSCTGLVRHALRSAGVDPNAPWDHMAYLSVYPTRDTPLPGDVVVYPDGVAMYAGDGQIVMANEVDQVVGTYGMYEVGTPLGFANPYGGASDPVAVDPLVEDAVLVDPLLDPLADQVVDPLADQVVDPLADQVVDPLADQVVDPLVDPLADQVVDPLLDPLVDPLLY